MPKNEPFWQLETPANDTLNFQAGIVSWGIGCGDKNTPAVYASVSEASCWIDSAVEIMLFVEKIYNL